MTIEKLDRRFCTVAVQKGFVTSDQLLEALEIQTKEDLMGKEHRLIGKILFDQGVVTLHQIEETIVSMSFSSGSQVQRK